MSEAAPHSGSEARGETPRVQTEIAIVGAGPAGIVLALELARAGRQVLLIESGTDAYDREIQRLGDTADDDPLHVAMSLATRRQLGGASNLWGGRCVPFDPVDFEPREIVGDAEWPIGYDEIAKYFARACDWCVCGEALFDACRVPALAGRSLVPGFPEGEVRATSLERWSLPTNFARAYRSALSQTPGLTVMTGFTCTEVVCDPQAQRVLHLRTQSLGGETLAVSAVRYVLACGGLEVTRLLFASDRHHPGGLGNHSGHLGRSYMAHVESRIARVSFTTHPKDTIYGHERDSDGVYVRRRFTFSREFLIRERLPNTAMWLVNPSISDPSHGSGILSFVYLMLASPGGRVFVAEGIRQAHISSSEPVSVRAHLRNVARDFGPAVRFAIEFGYGRFIKRGRKVPGFFVSSETNTYQLLYHGEHLPHRESLVRPSSSDRDALGMPRLETRLWFSDEDVENVLRAHDHLDAYLRRHRLGSLEYVHEDPRAAVREQLFGGYHQTGTTRMSARPQDGVVDERLAVHGFDDLFIASGSTFVTSGQANTTFMIVAFALRLADHLSATTPRGPDHAMARSAVETSPGSRRS